MTLRTKTLLISVAIPVGLIALLFFISNLILDSSVAEEEQQSVNQSVGRAAGVLNYEISDLDTIAGDWASWDDTYAFIEDRNQDYVSSNLVDSTFISLRINLMLFFHSSGRLVYAKAFDLDDQKEIPVPTSLVEQLTADNPLLQHPDLQSKVKGILLLPESPLLVASYPILTSQGEGPIRGTLIVGRFLNDTEKALLTQLTQSPVQVYRLNDAGLPPGLESLTASNSKLPLLVRRQNDQVVTGDTLLRDIYGKPALVMSVDTPRTAHEQAQRTLSYFFAAFLAVSLIFGLANRAALNGFILSRLTSLSSEIQGVAKSGDLTARLTTTNKDELGRLADRINEMLGALEQAHRQRLESEQRYRAVVEETQDGIFLVDTQTMRILEANAAFQNLVGYNAEELTHLTLYDLVAHDRASIDENTRRLQAEKRQSFGERKYRRKGGSLVEVEISANLIASGGSQVACVVVRDVTQRRWAEDALRRNEAHFRALIDNSLDVIGILNADGTVCYLSPAVDRMLGFNAERLMGRNAFDMIHPDDAAKVRSVFANGIEKPGFAASVEFRLQHQDGSWVYVETSARSMLDNPAVLGIVFSMRDITARKQAEKKLRESEERYRQAVENSPNAIFSVNREGMIQTWNRACESMFKYGQEFVGHDIQELLLEDGKDPCVTGMREQVFHKQSLSEVEISYGCQDGTARHMTSRLYPLLDSCGEVEACVFANTDVTERRRAQRELEEARRALERRNRQLTQILDAGNALRLDLEFDKVIREIVDAAHSSLGFGTIVLNLLDGERKSLRVCAHAGLDEEGRRVLEEAVYDWEEVARLMQERFRVGRCYFIPQGEVNWDRDLAGPTYNIVKEETNEAGDDEGKWRPDDALFVPIELRGGDTVGVLWLDQPLDGRRPNPDTLQAVEIYANQAAVAIENARLYEQINQELAERKRTEEALRESEERYRSLVQLSPDAIAIHAEGKLVFANAAAARLAGVTTPEELIGKSLLDFVHPDYRELAKEHVRQAREGGTTLPPLEEKFIRLDGSSVEVELAASPFTYQGKPAIQLIVHDITSRKRREAELHRRANEFAGLYETARDLTVSQDLPFVLHTIVERAAKLLSAACGGIYLYDPVRGDLEVSVATDTSIPLGVRLQVGEGMAGRVAQTRQPLIVDDYQTWEGRSPKFAGIPVRAVIEVPMLHRGELVGVLLVEEIGETTRQFTEEDARLLSLFAAQAASAVYNARLLQETRRHLEELQVLHRASQALSADLSLEKVLNAVADYFLAAIGVQSCTISSFDAASNEMVIMLDRDQESSVQVPAGGRYQPSDYLWVRPVFEEGHAYAVRRDDPSLDDATRRELDTFLWRSLLVVPLLGKGHVIGLVELGERRGERDFGPDEIRLAESLASQAAVAIENAGLYQQLQEELAARERTEREIQKRANEFAALYETAKELATQQDLPALLQTVVERAMTLLIAPCGFIYLYNAAQRTLDLTVEEGMLVPSGLRFSLGEGMAGRVAQTLQPLIVDDYQTWEYRSPQDGGMPYAAVVEVPMLFGGELIGVLGVSEIGLAQRKFTEADTRLLSLFAAEAASAVHSAHLLHQTSARAEQLALLYDAGLALNSVLEPRAQLEFLFGLAMKTLRADHAEFFRYNAEHMELRFELGVGYREGTLAAVHELVFALGAERGVIGQVAQGRTPLNLPDVFADPRWIVVDPEIKSGLWVPVEHEGQLLGVLSVLSGHVDAFTPQDERLLVLFANQAAVAMENARLFEETRRRSDQLVLLNRIASALSRTLDLDELLEVIYSEVNAALHADAFFIALYDSANDELNYRIRIDEGIREPPDRGRLAPGLTEHVIRSKKPLVIHDWEQEKSQYPPITVWGSMKMPCAWLNVPMLVRDTVVGVISLQSYHPNAFGEEEERLLATIADQAAVAVEKARLFSETGHRLQRLHALSDIDKAISSSLDLRVILEVVLDQVTTQLRVDAADILLHNPRTQTLSYASSRGFRSRALQHTELRLGEGLAGTAALERRLVHFPNLTQEADGLRRSPLLASEGFVAYFAVPLVAKGQTKGVLEIFHRAVLDPDQEWLDFAQALASQAAIAIDDAELFIDLQRSNVELTLAYDATIEGWSRALELRDQETEGHAARVTSLTLRLARTMGMGEQDLAHIRHGALLHDIGKMGIPDGILFKPGALSAEEWEIMRRHPTYAYEMLSPIAYLHQALDVPYCHHEKWDGTGYPRGLKGEQIPCLHASSRSWMCGTHCVLIVPIVGRGAKIRYMRTYAIRRASTLTPRW